MLVTAISPLDKNVFNANVLLQFKILTHGALATFTVTAFLQSHLTTHFVLLLPLLHPPISINTLTNIMKNRPTLVGFKIPQKNLYLTPSLLLQTRDLLYKARTHSHSFGRLATSRIVSAQGQRNLLFDIVSLSLFSAILEDTCFFLIGR